MASGYEMRVSDSEREATAAELREHFASGRLTQDELNERLDRAFAARTRGDLDALMKDLPSARPGGTGAAGGPAGQWTHGAPGEGTGRGWQPGYGGGPWGAGPGWTGPGGSGTGRPAGALGAVCSTVALMCALVVVGSLALFGGLGLAAGRPIGIVLILAALAFLRRLVFGRRIRSRGPRRRRW